MSEPAFSSDCRLMSFPDANKDRNLENQVEQKIWLRSLYWGITCALILYTITKELPVSAGLQLYLKQISSSKSDDFIICLSFVASVLLLMMATAILKYLCFGKNIWNMFAVTIIVAILHTTICFYGTFQQRNQASNPESTVINAKPRNAKMFGAIH